MKKNIKIRTIIIILFFIILIYFIIMGHLLYSSYAPTVNPNDIGSVDALGVEGWNALFAKYTGIGMRSSMAQGLIDKINMVNMDEDNKLINGEKNIIYVSSKGTTKKVISEESYLEQSIERNKIYLADDLLELRALITPKDRVYDISIVDYYEDGCIKEMLIEAKEK